MEGEGRDKAWGGIGQDLDALCACSVCCCRVEALCPGIRSGIAGDCAGAGQEGLSLVHSQVDMEHWEGSGLPPHTGLWCRMLLGL